MRAESELRRGAVVVGPGAVGFLRVDLGHRRGLAHDDDGIVDVAVERIPAHLRAPNSRFVAVTVPGGVARVEEEHIGRPRLDVEECARAVLDDVNVAGGSSALAFEPAHARKVVDLTVYTRQLDRHRTEVELGTEVSEPWPW